MGPGALSEILSKLPSFHDKNLLIGFDTSDDACVYMLREDLAVIQTVDFFPPIVDDPHLYGQIAAANALSDIYAMGGSPSLALNILCVPSCLPLDMVREILDGGYTKVREAGAIIAGGHSIDDPVPKYGLCVSGFIDPADLWSNATAREGDLLILTKPLGSGITSTAAKAGMLTPEQFAPSIDAMTTLNKYGRDAAAKVGVSACTDVTGFGLLGHACEMADASSKTIEIFSDKIPVLPYAKELATEGIIPGGAFRNGDYLKERVSFADLVPVYMRDILHDPQTSGGLLISVPERKAMELMPQLEQVCPHARVVGQVLPRGGVSIRVL